ncbi:MAG: FkbM family methyltransferase [Lentilitoribacter sp.]
MFRKYFEARYRRFWKSVAKRTKTTFLYDHPRHGRRLLDSTEPTSRELYAGYNYDDDAYEFVEAISKQDRITTFIDIGANWGGYSLLGARCGVPRIEAFEPNRKVFGLLASNITLNDKQTQIRAWNVAASDENSESELFLDPRATDVSTLTPDAMPERWNYSHRQSCAVRRLDDFLPMENETLIIKIDVEGAELKVFRGMQHILKTNKAHIFVELLKGDNAAETFLNSLGFEKKRQFGTNTYFAN